MRLDGRVALVTGASGGIGLETARVLGRQGCEVVIAARDEAKLSTAIATLRSDVPAGRFSAGVVDLASLASIRSFGSEIAARHDRIDLLVNNAGVMFPPLLRTSDGFELQFGTNHLGHFALTSALLELLLRGASARVVTVSSAGHGMSGIDFDDPNFERREYDKFVGYGQSKTANILFASELDRRYATAGIHSYSVHPGMIMTDLARHMTSDDFTALMDRARARAASKEATDADATAMPSFKTIEQGAATTLWAATNAELDSHGGAYCADCAVAAPEVWASDPEIAARLWLMSEELVGAAFQ